MRISSTLQQSLLALVHRRKTEVFGVFDPTTNQIGIYADPRRSTCRVTRPAQLPPHLQTTFHTHPQACYRRRQVQLGCPLESDWNQLVEMRKLFGITHHYVMAVEGIYEMRVLSPHTRIADLEDIERNSHMGCARECLVKAYVRTFNARHREEGARVRFKGWKEGKTLVF